VQLEKWKGCAWFKRLNSTSDPMCHVPGGLWKRACSAHLHHRNAHAVLPGPAWAALGARAEKQKKKQKKTVSSRNSSA
jgi:hypothetical protein